MVKISDGPEAHTRRVDCGAIVTALRGCGGNVLVGLNGEAIGE